MVGLWYHVKKYVQPRTMLSCSYNCLLLAQLSPPALPSNGFGDFDLNHAKSHLPFYFIVMTHLLFCQEKMMLLVMSPVPVVKINSFTRYLLSTYHEVDGRWATPTPSLPFWPHPHSPLWKCRKHSYSSLNLEYIVSKEPSWKKSFNAFKTMHFKIVSCIKVPSKLDWLINSHLFSQALFNAKVVFLGKEDNSFFYSVFSLVWNYQN